MNKRRVRNVLVTNRNLFEDMLVNSLINNNISYLQIEHEFHIFDFIYRFYELEKDESIIYPPVLDKDSIKSILDNLPDKPIKHDKKDIYIHNKALSKRCDYMLKQRIKNNRR